jgi:hypothetical protein
MRVNRKDEPTSTGPHAERKGDCGTALPRTYFDNGDGATSRKGPRIFIEHPSLV